MPFRMARQLKPVEDGCIVHISHEELAAMGIRPGETIDFEIWPSSHHLERIPQFRG